MENKWIKSNYGGIWYIEKMLGRDKQISYGFGRERKWYNSDSRSSTGIVLADMDEVLKLLKGEAVNRGLNVGFLDDLKEEDGNLLLRDLKIMENGKWLKKEELENLYGGINYEIY